MRGGIQRKMKKVKIPLYCETKIEGFIQRKVRKVRILVLIKRKAKNPDAAMNMQHLDKIRVRSAVW